MIYADEYLPEFVDFDAHAAAQDGLDEFREILSRLKPRPTDCDLSAHDLDKLQSEMRRKFERYWTIRGVDAVKMREAAAHMRAGGIEIQTIPQPNRR